MSIYSGFATRQQQQSYDQCLQTVVYLMQKRLLRFYKNQNTDEEKFISILGKMYSQMKHMQQHKYLQPKTSRTFQQLINYLKNRQIQEATLQDNKPVSVQVNQNQVNSQKKYQNSHSHSQAINNQHVHKQQELQQKSQRLQVKHNQPKQIQDFQVRPGTSNNRIRKRISSNSSHNNTNHINNNMIKNPFPSFDQQKDNNKTNKNDQQLQKLKVQNILNQSASKLVRVSRNQPRTFIHNNSNNQIKLRKQPSRSKSKRKVSEQNVEQQAYTDGNINQRQLNVQQLIKGYINKTKKSYMKGFNKKKDQIDQMLKLI